VLLCLYYADLLLETVAQRLHSVQQARGLGEGHTLLSIRSERNVDTAG